MMSLPVAAVSTEKPVGGGSRIEVVPVVRYEDPAGKTVRISVSGGYCGDGPSPSIARVTVHEHRLPERAKLAAVITVFLKRPLPSAAADELAPLANEGPVTVQVCDLVEHELHARVALGRPADELVLLDGSTSPRRPIPARPESSP